MGTNKSSCGCAHFLKKKVNRMVCLNPRKAWQLNRSNLFVSPKIFEKQKKITFKKPTHEEAYTELEIPCGTCLGCRLDHANEWALRIALECKSHKDNCFITLTYNNENLPINKNHITLIKKDFQDFIKRLRAAIDPVRISYFGCGEYGPKTHRSHGHFIIMGWKPDDLKQIQASKTNNAMFTSEKLQKIWGNGYITVEDVNYNVACYVARYCQKKAGLKPNKRKYTGETEKKTKIDPRNGNEYISIINKTEVSKYDIYGREKEFILMSKNPAIGLKYWEENKEKILRNKGIFIKINDKLKLKPIPRYFLKKLEQESYEKLYNYKYEIKKNMLKNREHILKKINTRNSLNEELTEQKKDKIYHEYLKKNLTEREKYLKRNQL